MEVDPPATASACASIVDVACTGAGVGRINTRGITDGVTGTRDVAFGDVGATPRGAVVGVRVAVARGASVAVGAEATVMSA